MYFYCFNMRKRKSPNSLSEPVTHWNLLSSSTITVTFDFPLCITAVQLVGVHCNKYLSRSASFHCMCSCVFARYLLKTTDDDFFFFFSCRTQQTLKEWKRSNRHEIKFRIFSGNASLHIGLLHTPLFSSSLLFIWILPHDRLIR